MAVMSRTRTVIGAMTGTSLDGIDVAAAEVTGTGLELGARLLGHAFAEIGPDTTEGLLQARRQAPTSAESMTRLALELGLRHVDAIERLATGRAPDLIAVHGQTVVHRPPLSWQMVNTFPIVARYGCPVVSDLRAADLAGGGEGAPITPLADWILFRASHRRMVVNLGGFCNVTLLPADGGGLDDIRGFDVCICNQLLDAVSIASMGVAYDDGGRTAAAGTPDATAVASLTHHLQRQRDAGRSLGTGDETQDWLAEHLDVLRPPDLAASAVEAIAACIAATPDDAADVLLAGGGALNGALTAAIERRLDLPVQSTDAVGVPVVAREALAIAVLGALCADGVPITLPAVTGCRAPAPVAGSWSGLLPHV
jgi:1,6-anhydro-N-acetylmuramate kinase